MDAIVVVATERSVIAVDEGNRVLCSLAYGLCDHAGADGVVIGEEPDAGIEVDVVPITSSPVEVAIATRQIVGSSVEHGIQPMVVRPVEERSSGDTWLCPDN